METDWARTNIFWHENEQIPRDSDGRIVDLRFQRVCGASVTLPEQTFSARSHHYVSSSVRIGMTWCGLRIANRNDHPRHLPSNGVLGGD